VKVGGRVGVAVNAAVGVSVGGCRVGIGIGVGCAQAVSRKAAIMRSGMIFFMGRIVSSLFGLCADSAQAKGTINGGTIEKIAAQGWMSLRKSLARSETMKTKILPPVLFFALLLAACGLSPTSVPATATPTLTPEPTLTFTPAPTATFTPAPTATPELLPADVLATLQGQEYTTVDSDGDKNIDKVVAPNGDTLYQLNSENNWQRMITFTLEGGDKMEMARFDTPEEAYDYMVKAGILWKATWGTKDLEKVEGATYFWTNQFHRLYETTGVGGEFGDGIKIHNNMDSLVSHIMVYDLDDDAVIVFLNNEDNLQAIYVDESASTVFGWMDQSRR